MKTETLKINVAQRILGISDDRILQKIKKLLDKENIFGYDAEGNPVKEKDYIKSLDKINAEIDNGTAKLSTTDKVKKRIMDGNHLEH